MMTIIYEFRENRTPYHSAEHRTIHERYKKGLIKATHKRVRESEFFLLPKIFIHEDSSISIVTGNQIKGGQAYIDHCKSHIYSIDRVNNVVLLVKKHFKSDVAASVNEIIANGVSLKQIEKELDTRETGGKSVSEALKAYSTGQLEEMSSYMYKTGIK